jgi:hypothetical protein
LYSDPLIFQRWVPVLSLRALATSSRVLKKDYPWSDDLEKLPDPSNNYPSSGQTHLNANVGRTLHDGVYLFPRETRRRYAAPQSNAFTLPCFAINIKLAIFHSDW